MRPTNRRQVGDWFSIVICFIYNEQKRKATKLPPVKCWNVRRFVQSSGYQSFQLKVTFYCWVGGGGGGGGGGWLSFLSFGQEGGCKRNTYDVGGHERKNALLKKCSALLHFSKHNKCSLSNQINSFTTQREYKCWSRIEELIAELHARAKRAWAEPIAK